MRRTTLFLIGLIASAGTLPAQAQEVKREGAQVPTVLAPVNRVIYEWRSGQ